MKIKWVCIVVLSTFFGSLVQAAIPRRNQGVAPEVIEILKAPLSAAAEQIYSYGPKGYTELRRISFQESYRMGLRWKAFMVMAKIGGEKSLPEIEKALESKDWFLRNAGLVALEKIDKKKAYRKAKFIFQNDRALMVRAEAIEVLRGAPTKKVRKLMWKKLYAKENYYRNKGLWIRKRIVQYLADFGRKSDLKDFLKIFNSKDLDDRELKAIAFPALERLMRKSPSAQLSSEAKVAYWHQQLREASRGNKPTLVE